MATEQLQLEEKKAFPLGMALEREPSVNERGKGGSVCVKKIASRREEEKTSAGETCVRLRLRERERERV